METQKPPLLIDFSIRAQSFVPMTSAFLVIETAGSLRGASRDNSVGMATSTRRILEEQANAPAYATCVEEKMKRILLFVVTLFLATATWAAMDINTASKEELNALTGIGPVKAQAIIDYRKANGPFKSVDDIKNVRGINAGDFNQLKGMLEARPGGCPEGPPCPDKKPKNEDGDVGRAPTLRR